MSYLKKLFGSTLLLSLPIYSMACDLKVTNSDELKAALIDPANSNKEICVAQGTYLPHQNDRNASFAVTINNVTVKGLGSNKEVVLSGNIGDPNLNTDNSYHVVSVVNQTGVVFKNITIANGYSELDRNNETGEGWGAGLYANNTDLSLKDVIVRNNQLTHIRSRGAGVGAPSSRIDIDHSSFQDNQAGNAGGGLMGQDVGLGQSKVTILNSEFRNNSASVDPDNSAGGGIGTLRSDSLSIKNSTFDNNTTTTGGGAIWEQQVKSVLIDNTTFSENTVSVFGTGGALYLAALDTQSITIKNCKMTNNKVAFGGGGAIALAYSPPSSSNNIENCQFSGNNATVGGAIWTLSPITIVNSKFTKNSAVQGGAIVDGLWPDDPVYAPGVINLVNTIFNENMASDKSGGQHMNCYAPVLPGELAGSVTLQNGQFKNPDELPVNCGL